MSTHLKLMPSGESSVDPQLASKFFNAPLELRQAVYRHLVPDPLGVHAYLLHGRLHSSMCIRTNKDIWGYDRANSNPYNYRYSYDDVWMRRLRSTWGPHWKCEEVALGLPHPHEAESDSHMAVLRTCKRMSIDIANFAADTGTVHVTDLDTLGYLLDATQTTPSEPSTFSQYLTSSVIFVRNLNIVSRLPLPVCQALDGLEHPEGSKGHQNEAYNGTDHYGCTKALEKPLGCISPLQIAATWSRLCPLIGTLQRLQTVHVWIDHDDKPSWTVVNERAILAPLSTLAIAFPKLTVSVNLPKLHPKYETPERHYTKESSAPPFTIERRIRQRYHAVEHSVNQFFRIEFVMDFPYLYGEFEDMSDNEAEEIERAMWKNGEDVEAEVEERELSSVRYVNYRTTHVPIDLHSSENDGNVTLDSRS